MLFCRNSACNSSECVVSVEAGVYNTSRHMYFPSSECIVSVEASCCNLGLRSVDLLNWIPNRAEFPLETANSALHRETYDYRNAVRRKLKACHNFMQIGSIAPRIMALLALTKPRPV